MTRALERAAGSFFRTRFSRMGSSERAAAEKAYMKSALRFHGVTIPVVRTACRDFVREHPDLTRADLRALATALFGQGFFDLRSAAVGVLELTRAELRPSDLSWLVELCRRAAAWAHVDWLAAKVIGPVLELDPSKNRRIRAWAKDESEWVRRTALLAQHDALRAGGGDFALFEAIAVPMLSEKSFWIRKAIGWVLREVSKKRPALVRAFVRRHGASMSALSRREATKYV